MAPSLPRLLARQPATTCLSSSTSVSLPIRSFSTTSSRPRVHIGPESPKFLPLAKLPQSEEHPPTRVKGVLPVPRNLFDKRGRKRLSPDFLAQTAKLSDAELRGEAPKSAHDAHRRRLADSRRRSLAAGIEGLWARQQKQTQAEAARRRSNFERNRRAALFQPDEADDVLTRSSISASTLNTAVELDPLRHEKAAASAERTANRAALKSQDRREALMQLYMAAGNFIVDEGELERKVNELFSPEYFAKHSMGGMKAQNIWQASNAPQGIKEMLAELQRTETFFAEKNTSESTRTATRQKLVSEALTGGKLADGGSATKEDSDPIL